MPRIKQFDKEAVLEKAKQLFWKQGYHATSIQNLVDHLGINRASLYNTFGGKNQLYEMAFQSYREENIKYLKDRLAQFEKIKDGLRQFFRARIKENINDPDKKGCFVINCTTEYLPHHKEILSELVTNKKEFQNIMEETLERGKDRGEFNANMDAKEVAQYLFTFFSGLQIAGKVKPDRKELFQTLDLGLQVLDR